jgi:hypothetical protein
MAYGLVKDIKAVYIYVGTFTESLITRPLKKVVLA